MAYMAWKESFSVNVREIDDQHKVMIALINELHAAMKEGKGKVIMSAVLAELIDYAATHFTIEEEYMTRFGFPGYAQHAGEHEAFTRRVLEFHRKYNEGSLSLSLEVMEFLQDWLVKHIQGTDRQYAPFFNTKGLR